MKQVKIRDWQYDDLEIYRKWNVGNHEWMKYNGPYYPKLSPDEVDQKISDIKMNIKQGNTFRIQKRLVIADCESDKMIGTVNWYWQSEETLWKSIGIAIYDEAFWNKGLGAEALSMWVDYLFTNDLEIVRLDLRTWSGNPGMMKLALKLGFVLEARFRKARIVDSIYYDSLGYGILREEWEKKL